MNAMEMAWSPAAAQPYGFWAATAAMTAVTGSGAPTAPANPAAAADLQSTLRSYGPARSPAADNL